MELRAMLDVNAFRMQLRIDGIRSALAWMKVAPPCGEPCVVLSSAQCAGAVSSSQRSSFIEEEQLCELPMLHQGTAVPAAILELAGDPAFTVEPAPNVTVRVVEASAVSVHQSTSRICDEIAERSYPILQRHGVSGQRRT
jgi:hypothetical protein